MPSLRLTPDMIDRLAQQQHERLRQDLSEIELSAPAPTTPSPLAKAVDAIRAAGGQADALRRLLAGASSLDARAALFVVRKESLSGWEGAGFDDDPAVAGSMEQISISRDEPAIAEVIASARPVLAEIHGTHPVPDFGQTVRGEALLLPIVVRDQVAGILYTDPLSSATPLDRAGLEVLAQITGLSVERLAYARMAPTASPAPSAQASETAPAAPSASDAGPPPSGSPDSSGATLSSGTAGAATTSGTFASAEPRDAVESVAPSPAEPSAP
ncbi:MAG: hypothetical protein JSV80_02225, partial [Acidobacteriota bacterium]